MCYIIIKKCNLCIRKTIPELVLCPLGSVGLLCVDNDGVTSDSLFGPATSDMIKGSNEELSTTVMIVTVPSVCTPCFNSKIAMATSLGYANTTMIVQRQGAGSWPGE